MQSTVTWKTDMKFDGKSQSGHTISLDGDAAHTAGPSPMEIVLLGLCGCTAFDVASILQKKREPFTGLTVSATAEQAAEPPRVFTHVKLMYRVAGAVSRKAVEDAVRLSETKYCSVSAMISKTAKIEYEIEFATE
ncbi:MAG: OsmC family protein [Acidobacteriaceae bacterium]|jgi:putative redox protein